MALVGIVLLMGIVKKNAIMMVDFALEAERTRGSTPQEAIHEASPAALPADHDDDDGGDARRAAAGAGAGAGSELRRPLGVTIIGGLLLSQFLTLVHHAGRFICSFDSPAPLAAGRAAAPAE